MDIIDIGGVDVAHIARHPVESRGHARTAEEPVIYPVMDVRRIEHEHDVVGCPLLPHGEIYCVEHLRVYQLLRLVKYPAAHALY